MIFTSIMNARPHLIHHAPPSEPYRNLLNEAGCEVMVHDPHVLEYPGVSIFHELDDVVKGADVVAVLTGYDEYFWLDAGVLKGLMGVECPVIVDGRNVVDAVQSFSDGFCIIECSTSSDAGF